MLLHLELTIKAAEYQCVPRVAEDVWIRGEALLDLSDAILHDCTPVLSREGNSSEVHAFEFTNLL